MTEPTSAQELSKRVFEKSHAEAIRFSIRRIEARSIIVSEVAPDTRSPCSVDGFSQKVPMALKKKRHHRSAGLQARLPIQARG
jgi:hypothetical protein